MLAQSRSRIFSAEEAPAQENGNNQLDEVLQATGEERRHDVKAVSRPLREPFLQLIGDLNRCSGERAVAAPSRQMG